MSCSIISQQLQQNQQSYTQIAHHFQTSFKIRNTVISLKSSIAMVQTAQCIEQNDQLTQLKKPVFMLVHLIKVMLRIHNKN